MTRPWAWELASSREVCHALRHSMVTRLHRLLPTRGTVMIDHDRLFKELLSTFFVEFLELFFSDLSTGLVHDLVRFLDKEICTDVTNGERYEADLVVQAQMRGHLWLY